MTQNLEQTPNCLQIGDWRFYVGSHELVRNDETIRLEPRVASLLQYLASRPGEPVTRAALLEALWPGMVVSDEALTNAVNKLRRAFGDDRANPRVIETIPKAGYRLLLPVRQPEPVSGATEPDDGTSTPNARAWPRRFILLAFLTAAAVVAGLLVANRQLTVPEPSTVETTQQHTGITGRRPVLAVLPFDEPGADPEQEYFADGVTDDLITRLAKNPGLMVIARDSTFFYKNQPLDPGAVARKLNARYLLRGSLRREGEVLKLNVWLVNVDTGANIWAEHFEQPVGQIFKVQNAIANGITKALAVPVAGPADDGGGTANPRAYDQLLLGKQHFYRFESRAENLKARACFEEAVRLDPGFATAHAMLAWTYAFEAMNGWSDDPEGALRRAEQIATHAIELQPVLPLAYFVRGLSYRERHEYIKALVEAQKAIEYDPSYANAYVLLATLLYYAGRPEEGLEQIRQAMQINPHHPYNYHFHLGQAYFVLHRYREAIDAFNHGLSSYPASERMRVWLAASLAQAGEIDEAKWEGEQIMAANPDFSIQRMVQVFPFKNPDDTGRFIAGLRLAGLH